MVALPLGDGSALPVLNGSHALSGESARMQLVGQQGDDVESACL
jgi:hypothetical protein